MDLPDPTRTPSGGGIRTVRIQVERDERTARVRLSGACASADLEALRAVLGPLTGTASGSEPALIIDATGLDHLDPQAAAYLVQTEHRAGRAGRRFSLLRKDRSSVDRALRDASRSAGPGAAPEVVGRRPGRATIVR